ncbi:MAG TPA: hypothetical protein PLW93_03525 [Candidatus Absconditabacterales bacterium]|nr:hypothetical protein [Candidatus Absconditabacterales bacterium]
MQRPQKFIDALQEDSEGMYEDLKNLGVKKFSQKWGISDVTMRKYMPKKDFISPEEMEELRNKIQTLKNEGKSNIEIKEILNISMYRVVAFSRKDPRHQLTDEQKREIRESKETTDYLAKKYNTMKSIIDELRRFKKIGIEERVLNTGKWDRSEPKQYWKNFGEIHEKMGPAKFIKFNTPLGLPEEKGLSK